MQTQPQNSSKKPRLYLKTEEMTTNPDEKPYSIPTNTSKYPLVLTPLAQQTKNLRVSATSNPAQRQKVITPKPRLQFSDFYLQDLKHFQDLTPRNPRKSPENTNNLANNELNFPVLGVNSNPSVPLNFSRNVQKTSEWLPNHVREFYSTRKDFAKVFEDFDTVSFCLDSVTERVKCYRCELGNVLLKCSVTFRNIFEKVLENSIKMHNEFKSKSDKQMQENLLIIERLEKEKKELEIKNRNLKNLYNFQESEYKICRINCDSLQNEIVLLHELLKKDVLSLINHLGTIENVNQREFQQNDPSDNLALGLHDLNKIISTLEEEQSNKHNLMGNMNNLLKAMLKGGKQDAYTQIDEGELAWRADLIVKKPENPTLTVTAAEGYSMNLDSYFTENMGFTNHDLLKLKEKTLNKQENAEDNWNLPVSLVLFLENVTKQNDTGRVLPWMHFKRTIFEVYSERLKFSWEIRGSLFNTSVSMDEFLCLFFLKTHKLRRTAEIKLLEFLVSLKYYSKMWPRAALFSNFCGISAYLRPSASPEPNFSYDFDAYLLEYFLHIFAKTSQESFGVLEQSDGQTVFPREKLEELVSHALFFNNEYERKKFIGKASTKFARKPTNSEDNGELLDLDRVLEGFIEEYFEARKRNFRVLAKNFAKFFETDHGLLSFEDVKAIVAEVTDVESPLAGALFVEELTKLRVFLYALTCSKNKYDLVSRDFAVACAKFGVDSPFPSVHAAQNREKTAISNEIHELHRLKSHVLANVLENQEKKTGSTRIMTNFERDNEENERKKEEIVGEINKNVLKVDAGSSMFAQHFSILRELRHYCLQLREAVKSESDMDTVWKHMDNIVNILEVGCQFLNFPIQIT